MTRRPNAVRAYAVSLGVVPHKTDGALCVFEACGMSKPKRRTMVDHEHGVPGGKQRRGSRLKRRSVLQRRGIICQPRVKRASANIDDADSVRLRRIMDIHQQRKPRVHPVDHILLNSKFDRRLGLTVRNWAESMSPSAARAVERRFIVTSVSGVCRDAEWDVISWASRRTSAA